MMETKKRSKLDIFRKKVLPHFHRNKTSPTKHALQPNHIMDSRMSVSVPDMTNMSQDFEHLHTSSSHNVSSRLNREVGGSGLQVPGAGAKKSDYRRSMPPDCTDWAFSQGSVSGFCGEESGSMETQPRVASGIEPEDLAMPEIITVYCPSVPAQDASPDNTQVQYLLFDWSMLTWISSLEVNWKTGWERFKLVRRLSERSLFK